jgi:hypothetical protein
MSTTSKFVVPSTSMSPDISNAVPINVCVSVTCPFEAIAIASESEAEPILPASAITIPAPVVIVLVDVIVSTKASLNLTPVVPRSTSLSVCGPNTPFDTNTCSALSA